MVCGSFYYEEILLEAVPRAPRGTSSSLHLRHLTRPFGRMRGVRVHLAVLGILLHLGVRTEATVEQCDDGNTSDGDSCSSSCQSTAPAVPLMTTPWMPLAFAALLLIAGLKAIGSRRQV